MREKILNDLKEAMRSQNKETLSVIRMLKGSMQLEEIEKKKELSDSELLTLISKQIKTLKETIEEFKKGNREDLTEKANKEIEILSAYLPKQLTEDEIRKEIDAIFNEINPKGIQDMGRVMAMAKEKLNGKADMGFIGKIVKEKLGL